MDYVNILRMLKKNRRERLEKKFNSVLEKIAIIFMIKRRYYTVVQSFEFYFRVTIFYKQAQQVSVILFLAREKDEKSNEIKYEFRMQMTKIM